MYRYAYMYLHTYTRGRKADFSPLLDMYCKYEDKYIVACKAGMRTLRTHI